MSFEFRVSSFLDWQAPFTLISPNSHLTTRCFDDYVKIIRWGRILSAREGSGRTGGGLHASSGRFAFYPKKPNMRLRDELAS